MISTLIIASGNIGKIREFRQFLFDFPFNIKSQPEGINVEETGKTFAENARIKALAVARLTGEYSLADDSGLSVNSLGGGPGVHSARYANNDDERIHRLLQEMEFFEDRFACFKSALCVASPNNEILLEVEGRCNGLITKAPRGKNGFGYDPIFEVLGTGLTFAEMESKDKKALGHRGKAFSLLEPKLRKLF